MINRSQASDPARKPRLRGGLARSPRAHAAMSMLILGLAAGTAMYLIMARRENTSERAAKIRQKRIENLHARAAAGQTDAQVQLAAAYAAGIGVTYDPVTAARWNKAAADSGNPDAQFRLARALTEGEGIAADFAEAASLLRKSADQGNIEAQWTLGVYYFRGIGVEKDAVESYRWLSRAAASGSAPAQLALDEIRKQMTPEQIAEAGRRPLPANALQSLEKTTP